MIPHGWVTWLSDYPHGIAKSRTLWAPTPVGSPYKDFTA